MSLSDKFGDYWVLLVIGVLLTVLVVVLVALMLLLVPPAI